MPALLCRGPARTTVAETFDYSKDGTFRVSAKIFATRQIAGGILSPELGNLYCVEARFAGKSTEDAKRITVSGKLYMREMKLNVPESEKANPSIDDLRRFLGLFREDRPTWGDTSDLYAAQLQCTNCPGGTIQTNITTSTGSPPGNMMVMARYLKRPVFYANGTMMRQNDDGFTVLLPEAKWIMDTPLIPACADGGECLSSFAASLNADLRADGVNTGVLGTFVDLVAAWYAARR